MMRVKTDRLQSALLREGDSLIINSAEVPAPGDTVLARSAAGRAVLRRYETEPGGAERLVPVSEDQEPGDEGPYHIAGVVVGMIRRF